MSESALPAALAGNPRHLDRRLPPSGTRHGRARARIAVEWQTLVLTGAVYTAFALLTWFYHALPWEWVAVLGGYLVALHGSLQHEAVHGHPTRSPRINELLVLPSLWLFIPFRLYRESHLRHHRDEWLTDPMEDPESYYLSGAQWARRGTCTRALLWVHNTAPGRLLLGPLRVLWRLGTAELARLACGDTTHARAWLVHALGGAIVLTWVVGVCRIPLAAYLGLFVYPGLALTLLRSFAEHEARAAVEERTAIVEAGPLFSLLFLNNNLHVLHHAEPGLPWYRLPRRYREQRAELLARNGGLHYPGYVRLVLRHLVRPRPLVHPLAPRPPGSSQNATAPVGERAARE